jgi:transcription initiation factor IIF auxiliary subunit
MLKTFWKSARMLAAAAMLYLFAAPSYGLSVGNTSTYAGADRWNWTIFIDADPDTLRQINCVDYILHPTFPKPVRKVCNQPGTKFAFSANGWGTFTVKVKIYYKNKQVDTLEHPLVFRQEPAPVSRDVTARNWAREIEPGWWQWGIHLEGPGSELDRIRCVEYTLHPTFPNPVRLVCNPEKGFELIARGWGEFRVGIKIIFKDGSVTQLGHMLEFH